ncbi:MAG: ABC transporter permease [Clostridia bacterium]|nr:ABC transporter permease [Clostridia bacterium]MBR4034877.1 ABC transporter permease [Clostridia bacterium]
MTKKSSKLSTLYMALIFTILYLPIGIMILFSFNESKSMTNFTGLSLRWYKELFSSGKAFEALKYSLLIALLSALISTVIGTLAAYGLYRMRKKLLYRSVMAVTNIPMMNPDIVTGISLLLLFVFIQTLLQLQNSLLGFGTLLIAHITFNVPYVILSVLPRFRQMDPYLSEAALDLGCTPFQVFYKIELPSVMSGIISGAIMAFTLSLDDFVISNFTIGTDFQTLPILIYSMTKREVTPDMNALCTIMFVVIFVLLLLSNFATPRSEQEKALRAKKKAARLAKKAAEADKIGGAL